ncbi:SDR family NAD(P)-dependent oxidoreductase [Pseudophaeobacter arcticus]|uniref:SDR family NAD(P)-dependent oxidoreductase n=1 Tax=Pseudophaeobacter arcticus TaxID=385492 RepID=UPI00042436E6|nr:SDR family NAD(P)-dependent oxidoreductase [Pseudophaeobacter arcticus]
MTQKRKTIVITGASRGIGAALVNAYAAQGDEVIAVARSRPKTSWPNVQPLAADLATDAGIARLAEVVAARSQGIDTLINNAGIQNQITLTEPVDPATIDAEIALNLSSPIKLTLALMPFLHTPGSTVVNVTSLVALHPKPSAPVYSATKAGLASFTRALRHQMSGKGITVVEAIPPLVATDMTAGRGRGKLTPEDMAAAIVAGVAAGATRVAPGKSKLVLRLNRLLPGLVAGILARE